MLTKTGDSHIYSNQNFLRVSACNLKHYKIQKAVIKSGRNPLRIFGVQISEYILSASLQIKTMRKDSVDLMAAAHCVS